MAKKKQEKTNVMILLDQAKVDYVPHLYTDSDAISGVEVASFLNQDPDRVYKTLVTEGRSGENYVFLVPVAKELDLKKAASVASEKHIAMVTNKELLPLTGYVHGGCRPLGMKKDFKTFIDAGARHQNRIMFSAGKIGFQVEIAIEDLHRVLDFQFADISQ